MPKLIAKWNTVRGVWEKPTGGGLLCEHSEPYWETWPTSGTTRNGQAFERPTSELRTVVSGSSFSRKEGKIVLLPTLSTQDLSGRCRDWGGDIVHALTCDCRRSLKSAVDFDAWEGEVGREAPDPTFVDETSGRVKLSIDFAEWLMGLPRGWIEEAGIQRRDALKMAGNGVVPQQAERALSVLKDRFL